MGREANGRKNFLFFLLILLIFVELILVIAGLRELAFYNSMMVIVFLVFYLLSGKIKFSNWVLGGFILVAVLNAAGGLVIIDGVRLYDSWIGNLRWDMFIHFLAMFCAYFVIYDFLKANFKGKEANIIAVAFVVALGLGALYEIIELFGVSVLGNQEVGDYMNNALDLVFDFLGAILGGLVISFREF